MHPLCAHHVLNSFYWQVMTHIRSKWIWTEFKFVASAIDYKKRQINNTIHMHVAFWPYWCQGPLFICLKPDRERAFPVFIFYCVKCIYDTIKLVPLSLGDKSSHFHWLFLQNLFSGGKILCIWTWQVMASGISIWTPH